MLINYVPGEECRVAVVRDGRLEELHAERVDTASHVGNIYVGKVLNVEAGIQAAFIDFGLEHNGFLHITDLHPRYFPGDDGDSTERVGKKTPRRERPPIQACLRRGQEVIVQVLKEGIGSKGPTLTSYLSVPGRFLVMMPQMDNVGVSRRVEDEERRRAMREILDQLDLPEGFGFILRTAGMNRNKTELKRDLAYLMRLWKDMQRRLESGSKPRLLFAESDLLVRALRDVLTSEIDEIIVDDVSALRRASRFLKIVAPRAGQKLLRYNDPTPIFHAYGVEPQIQLIHAREVPLPSGGSIVIDEAEALVAIDVNSGKMRDNRDAETTAFKTNVEAVDEICRQLRLRDLGGVVINDLIDMRSRKNQREIEQRFKENLKRDRANTKTLPISAFGIVEMTRQRMRGSHGSVHFAPCPACRGSGLVQRPSSALAETLRELARLLNVEKVRKVEVSLSARVAGELLSTGRLRLGRLERLTGKHVDVRVSETAPMDHVSFYAYDEQGADIDLAKLPKPQPPKNLEVWETSGGDDEQWAADPVEEAAAIARAEAESEAELQHQLEQMEMADEGPIDMDLSDEDTSEISPTLETAGGKKKRRRRRRGGKGRGESEPAPSDETPKERAPAERRDESAPGEDAPGGGGKKKRRRRRRRRGGKGREDDGTPIFEDGASDAGERVAPPRATGKAIPPPPPKNIEGPRGDSWDLEPIAPTARRMDDAPPSPLAPVDPNENGAPSAPLEGAGGGKRKRRRRRRGGKGGADQRPNGEGAPSAHEPEPTVGASNGASEGETPSKKKRSRRKKKGASNDSGVTDVSAPSSERVSEPKPEVVVKKARPRRKKKAAANKSGDDEGAEG